MTNHNSSLTDMQLLGNYHRIRNQLPPATINMCRQVAWSLNQRLPFLLSTGVREKRLVQEAMSGIKQRGINFTDMSIEDAIMLIFMLISEDARGDMESLLHEMVHSASDHNQKIKALL